MANNENYGSVKTKEEIIKDKLEKQGVKVTTDNRKIITG